MFSSTANNRLAQNAHKGEQEAEEKCMRHRHTHCEVGRVMAAASGEESATELALHDDLLNSIFIDTAVGQVTHKMHSPPLPRLLMDRASVEWDRFVFRSVFARKVTRILQMDKIMLQLCKDTNLDTAFAAIFQTRGVLLIPTAAEWEEPMSADLVAKIGDLFQTSRIFEERAKRCAHTCRFD